MKISWPWRVNKLLSLFENHSVRNRQPYERTAACQWFSHLPML
jgi:hypothetical protein